MRWARWRRWSRSASATGIATRPRRPPSKAGCKTPCGPATSPRRRLDPAYDIHAIDAALWAAGQRPVAATGASRICRSNPRGDARDVCDVIYQYANGLVHTHTGQALPNGADGELD